MRTDVHPLPGGRMFDVLIRLPMLSGLEVLI